jgi:hypothetical protein
MIDFGWPIITIGLGGGIYFMPMGCCQNTIKIYTLEQFWIPKHQTSKFQILILK